MYELQGKAERSWCGGTHSDSSVATGHLYWAVLNRQISAYCRTAETQTSRQCSVRNTIWSHTGRTGALTYLRSSSSSRSCWCCWWREHWRWLAPRGNRSERTAGGHRDIITIWTSTYFLFKYSTASTSCCLSSSCCECALKILFVSKETTKSFIFIH